MSSIMIHTISLGMLFKPPIEHNSCDRKSLISNASKPKRMEPEELVEAETVVLQANNLIAEIIQKDLKLSKDKY